MGESGESGGNAGRYRGEIMGIFTDFDEEYWEDESFERDMIRSKCRDRGIDEEDIEDFLRHHTDAFSITDEMLDELADEVGDDDLFGF